METLGNNLYTVLKSFDYIYKKRDILIAYRFKTYILYSYFELISLQNREKKLKSSETLNEIIQKKIFYLSFEFILLFFFQKNFKTKEQA